MGDIFHEVVELCFGGASFWGFWRVRQTEGLSRFTVGGWGKVSQQGLADPDCLGLTNGGWLEFPQSFYFSTDKYGQVLDIP